MSIAEILSRELGETLPHVQSVVDLLDAGNTVPFVARYRKEMTGSMDDQQIRKLSDRLAYLRGLEKRRGEIAESISAQGKLTEELTQKLNAASTLAELEDVYRPYKPRRTTRASVAKERGLTPLAAKLMRQLPSDDPFSLAAAFVNPEKGVETPEDALAGARDIIAERIAASADIRGAIKRLARARGEMRCSAAKEEDSVYSMYYDFHEPLSTLPAHRVLAMNRGEREGYLKPVVDIPREGALGAIKSALLRGSCPASAQVEEAAEDSWARLVYPSLAREIRAELTEKASEQAISTFALNLRPLLMQPPVKGKVTLGVDPAYRTGCKLAVVDGTGKVLDTAVIYPTPPHNKVAEATASVRALIKKHGIEVASIGNGTAGREAEQFMAGIAGDTGVSYAIVSEAGASVYSASKLAAEEFPEYDVSLRSAVSIARRLQDPLAELVKIDPRSIGVGQYQHDMPEQRLDETLSGVVEDCVNSVGVDVNTASASLLNRVAGINATVAKNIVAYREENGAFQKRGDVARVPRLGAKAYEQCAGFLRVPESQELLDNTGVHPESYAAARKLVKLCGCSAARGGGFPDIAQKVRAIGEERAAEACGIGVPTLRDMVKELQKPGRDPRDELPPPLLRSDVMDISDLAPGMELTGTVRNIVDFGAFVDIGVHQDGLVHVSRIASRYIKHPSEAVRTGDVVTVWVLEADAAKKRISLTMIKPD